MGYTGDRKEIVGKLGLASGLSVANPECSQAAANYTLVWYKNFESCFRMWVAVFWAL